MLKFIEDINDNEISFCVLFTRYKGKWIVCKHFKRSTYECPGGKRKAGETISQTAKRELEEETGIKFCALFPISPFKIVEGDNEERYGYLFYAEAIRYNDKISLHYEIKETVAIEDINSISNWTYPQFMDKLIERTELWIEKQELICRTVSNPFRSPLSTYEKLKKINVPIETQERFTGDSILVIFLTKYCNQQCSFCIYHSKPRERNFNSQDEFNINNISDAVSFINHSSAEYLLIAGGGEPFENFDSLVYCVKNCKVRRIIIATNGTWARTSSNMLFCLNQLSDAVNLNNNISEVTLRISVDKWHCHTKPLYLKELINTINSEYSSQFTIEFHSIIGDETLLEICSTLNWNIVWEERTNNSNVIKKSGKYARITVDSGKEIPVEFAKLFFPNLFCDINDKKSCSRAMEVFYRDLTESQLGNFSLAANKDGNIGLDILINFNGNVTTWGNYQLKDITNVHNHNYNYFIEKLYGDVISYSFLKMSVFERNQIVEEVDPLAVIRSVAINVRDYSGAYLLYEQKTKVYYCLRILQSIKDKSQIKLPDEVKEWIALDVDNLRYLYFKSDYSIIDQYLELGVENELQWKMLYKLIERSHFNTDVERISNYTTDSEKEMEQLKSIFIREMTDNTLI